MAGHAFVDTSAFYALAHDRDQHHSEALLILARLVSERAVLCTSIFVVADTYGLLLQRFGRHHAQTFLTRARDGAVRVLLADTRDHERAEAILRQYDDQDFSYVDAVSFAVIERLGIRRAFAFDQHFAVFRPRQGALAVNR